MGAHRRRALSASFLCAALSLGASPGHAHDDPQQASDREVEGGPDERASPADPVDEARSAASDGLSGDPVSASGPGAPRVDTRTSTLAGPAETSAPSGDVLESESHGEDGEAGAGASGPAEPSGHGAKEEDGEASEEEASSNFLFRYLEGIFGMPENPNEPRFIAYPVVAFAPETSWEFGVSALAVYYANNNPENRLSEINAYAFFTLEGQLGLQLEHANYTDRDEWFILGEGRFQSFPLQYYGIGPDTPSEPRATVDELSLLIRERVLRKITESLYLGLELSFDLIGDVRFNWGEGVVPAPPNGAEGSLNMSLGLGVVYDNRHNVLNVRDGLFAELAFLHSNQAWGSDFDFTVLESDTRYFIPINERDTLAAQLFGRFTFGDVPFNELSTLGGESLMRGYYLGRFRDRHFVGAQLEYRFLPLPFFTDPFWRRFGASLFVATGVVFPGPDLPPVSDFVVAGGGGLRFLLFPDKDVYTRGDFAVTEEGTAFYLLIGEAF
ncbi:MAG: BamA/TamA family outer membrane protein [Myxococcota bacterium]